MTNRVRYSIPEFWKSQGESRLKLWQERLFFTFFTIFSKFESPFLVNVIILEQLALSWFYFYEQHIMTARSELTVREPPLARHRCRKYHGENTEPRIQKNILLQNIWEFVLFQLVGCCTALAWVRIIYFVVGVSTAQQQ